jgi:hypothetical protein
MSSGPSKVIVLDPDPRAGRQVQLGFEREGVPALVPALSADASSIDLDGAEPGIVLVGGKDGQALDLVRRARALLKATKNAHVPIVFTGKGPSRRDLETAGADEVVTRPAYLRDIVTIGRMLRGVPRDQRDHLVGSLVETTGVLTLVRAFSALGRSAVLTLIRGLRRGEVRFFHGEVTSAQVGLIHGQAALHQLLLWTDARFDYSHEDIVRRQQIPLAPDELFADAERFLEGIREHAGNLSPATVLEQDVQRVQMLGKQIPTEVHGVLRMFDGHRVLADVLEDSPYRVFETLRVAQKAVEVGLLRVVESQRPKSTWRAVLAIEEWLVGSETRDAVVERTSTLDTGPVASAQPKRKGKGKGKRRSKKMKAATPTPDSKDIDWGALVPRVIGAEVGPLSGVVPAQETHGEVELPSRGAPREGLEALMDTDKRQKIFPTDIGLEPKVVVSSGDTDEWQRIALDAKEKAEIADKAARDRETSAQRANSDAFVLGETAAKLKAQSVKTVIANADTPPAGMPTVNVAPVDAGHTRGKIASLPARPPGADEIDAGTAALVAVPQYLGEMKSDPVAAVTAVPATASEPRAHRAGATDAKELVRALVAEALPPDAVPQPTTGNGASGASAATTAPVRPVEETVTTRFEKSADEASKPADGTVRASKTADETGRPFIKASADDSLAFLRPQPGVAGEDSGIVPLAQRVDTGNVPLIDSGNVELIDTGSIPLVDPMPARPARAPTTDDRGRPNALIAEPITVSEAARTSIAVADVVTVRDSGEVAVVTAKPATLISEQPSTAEVASLEPARTVVRRDTPPTFEKIDATALVARENLDATPEPAEDEPSDGVVRGMIATADTARLARAARMRPPEPEHDGPAIKEATGEIRERPRNDTKEPPVVEPSILVEASGPSILVADLAAAHDAIAAVTAKAAATPPPPDAASPSRELAVSDVRRDAVEFSAAEEAFFSSADKSAPAPRVHHDSFDDLDEGYQPPKFWDRVFGRKPKK